MDVCFNFIVPFYRTKSYYTCITLISQGFLGAVKVAH